MMVNGIPAPWADDRPSLFGYLVSFPLEPDGSLPQAASSLPDEDVLVSRSGSKLRWAAGALDGVFGRHVQASEATSLDKALHMLEATSHTPTPEHVKDFYDLVNEGDVLSLADPLLDAVRTSRTLDASRLHAFAQWLARESPDRAPVKMGIALLGLFRPPQDTELLLRLGLHDEFTLYAAVALGNSLAQPEREEALWSLARRVDGWGRIHLVERLAGSTRPDLKAWLLREGYKNSVMHEYLAHACATGGGLLPALQADAVDAPLLDGAGELIQALLRGGPAEDISDYDDGAQVVQHYLAHAATRAAPPLTSYLAVSDIAESVDSADRTWAPLEAKGWTPEHRRRVRDAAASILSAPHWPGMALAALDEDDRAAFWVASTAAQRMGMDTWETHFARQRDGRGEHWFDLMRTGDPARVERVIALAEAQIDLRAIATGPSDAPGLGPEYRQHMALDFILQSLGEFPGQGWPLVAAGLRSPVIRNRNMALRALAAWDRVHWPDGALALLSQAEREEPDDDIRARMAQLLAA
ncbi:hypothetical protein [Piscinibacter sp. XHJ-5]|uniref:hypothetical protein n=1 Tax=Piscinibacter sp. XHJ-5 TaxID=3037797 RepID=UPI0024536708|nr:hypothetical protein [Piscinibacter sp. XHJ-5]